MSETEGLHDSPRSGPYTDSCAQLCELGGRFVDVDLDIGIFGQGNGTREPADAASAVVESVTARKDRRRTDAMATLNFLPVMVYGETQHA